MPSNFCCNQYNCYIFAVRFTVLVVISLVAATGLMLVPVRLPEPSGRSFCSDALRGPNSHTLPNRTCEVKTLEGSSVIDIGDEGRCRLVMTGSQVLLELVSEDLLTVNYCIDGEYAYANMQTGKYIRMNLGLCGPYEFIFDIASAGNSSIAYLSRVSTRGFFDISCSVLGTVLLLIVLPIGTALLIILAFAACAGQDYQLNRNYQNETSCYRTLICCSGLLCIECYVRDLIDLQTFTSWQDRLQNSVRARFSGFRAARLGELPVPPQLEMEPV